METDGKGILTEAAIEIIVERWDMTNRLREHREKLTPFPCWENVAPIVAEAQHQVDVKAVKEAAQIAMVHFGDESKLKVGGQIVFEAILRALKGEK